MALLQSRPGREHAGGFDGQRPARGRRRHQPRWHRTRLCNARPRRRRAPRPQRSPRIPVPRDEYVAGAMVGWCGRRGTRLLGSPAAPGARGPLDGLGPHSRHPGAVRHLDQRLPGQRRHPVGPTGRRRGSDRTARSMSATTAPGRSTGSCRRPVRADGRVAQVVRAPGRVPQRRRAARSEKAVQALPEAGQPLSLRARQSPVTMSPGKQRLYAERERRDSCESLS